MDLKTEPECPIAMLACETAKMRSGVSKVNPLQCTLDRRRFPRSRTNSVPDAGWTMKGSHSSWRLKDDCSWPLDTKKDALSLLGALLSDSTAPKTAKLPEIASARSRGMPLALQDQEIFGRSAGIDCQMTRSRSMPSPSASSAAVTPTKRKSFSGAAKRDRVSMLYLVSDIREEEQKYDLAHRYMVRRRDDMKAGNLGVIAETGKRCAYLTTHENIRLTP